MVHKAKGSGYMMGVLPLHTYACPCTAVLATLPVHALLCQTCYIARSDPPVCAKLTALHTPGPLALHCVPQLPMCALLCKTHRPAHHRHLVLTPLCKCYIAHSRPHECTVMQNALHCMSQTPCACTTEQKCCPHQTTVPALCCAPQAPWACTAVQNTLCCTPRATLGALHCAKHMQCVPRVLFVCTTVKTLHRTQQIPVNALL